MSKTTVTVNTTDPVPRTPGTYSVRAFYTETDSGHLFGPFASREAAENCALVLAGRSTVVKVTIEGA